jgi:hypothetical protein
MHQTNFIVREPLLDPKQRVIGYELCWQQQNGMEVAAADLESLVGFVAEHLVDEDGWLLRDKLLFLDAVPGHAVADACTRCRPSAPCCRCACASSRTSTRAAVQALRAGGVGISLRDANLKICWAATCP